MKGLKISVGIDPVYKFGVARVFSIDTASRAAYTGGNPNAIAASCERPLNKRHSADAQKD